MTQQIILYAALLLTFVLPFAIFFAGERTAKRFKKSLIANMGLFFTCLLIGTIMVFSGNASAAGEAAAQASNGLGFVGAGLAVGLTCIGGGIAVGSTGSAAIGACSEDSSNFARSMVFVGLAEGVCVYGLIIAFMILSRV